ncbi:MAG: KDO2-lipid IV(A) lauroyltransferase [Luteibaculaceae bacterium]
MMNLYYPIFKALGKLPPFVVYSLARVGGFVLFRILAYRKGIIQKQIHNAFPNASQQAQLAIFTNFKRNFEDVMLETIFLFGKSPSFFTKRVQFSGISELNRALEHTSQIIVCGHVANWEWGCLIQEISGISNPVYVAYHPLKNTKIDAVVKQSRERFGATLIPMKHMARKIVEHKNQHAVFILIADQCPANLIGVSWQEFLHQDTPFIAGPEKLAQKFDLGVFYGDAKRIKKGHYHYSLGEINAQNCTQEFAQKLEKSIQDTPGDWLWSHRRWKRTRQL